MRTVKVKTPSEKRECKYCLKTFRNQVYLDRHIGSYFCKGMEDAAVKKTNDLLKQISDQADETRSLNIRATKIINNFEGLDHARLHSDYIDSLPQLKTDYLQMLDSNPDLNQDGLAFIKDCALMGQNGDLKLIYVLCGLWQQSDPVAQVKCLDTRKDEYLYYDRDGHPIQVIRSTLTEVLARHLRQAYTQGLQLSYQTLNLDEFRKWNEHINQLYNYNYQSKLQKHINIPGDSDVEDDDN
jgi:hypothetical protein